MSKKKIIISISIILSIFLLALIAYYFLVSSSGNNIVANIPGFKQFFPFGGGGTEISTTTTEFPPIKEPDQTPNYTQKLRKIWALPVAGFGVIDTKAGTVVRHIERATGHIYETELFSPNQNRISNTTIPIVYNAFWSSNLNSVIIEQLAEDEENVNSYTLSIKTGTTTENNISGSFLSDKIEDLNVLGDTVFNLQKLNTGSVGFVSAIGSNKFKQVWNSPITEVTSQFVNKNTIAITTKPHQDVPGYLYFVNTNTTQSTKILGGIYGLSTLVENDASNLIYLSELNNPTLYLYNLKTRNESIITPTTYPEKCVWSQKDVNVVYCAVPENQLDRTSMTNWYMGLISFNDDIWKYDLKNNTSEVISNLNTDGGENIDVIKPKLSTNEQYLLFINKKDNSLWSLDLTK